ncbi:Flp pilus assembly protein, ATPase CpaE [Candidatus Ornithobacterium hominis]|uniref:Flp pilus assembly protein, ATPase CpaE n=1 Tax=Candidatus Ornithobacterium hominis TaxID=2497989 RepID=A0A383U2R8_9FLAO|nr:ParA family protein [Candidatus Ornithobacterium hominis]MCT7905114.1 ParA family protein [Candidatus Ornithobacterium hominis]SZD74222.1 Flp pilus assembly protein, ATPase CpaE [Candidatus Ornithobacterium hominis]
MPIITFSHQKGGVGKSTLAFNVAKKIYESANVCIVDYDKQGSLSQVSDMVYFHILENVLPEELPELDYDFVLVDTPPYLATNLTKIFEVSDIIVVPTRAGILDLFAIKGTIDLITEAKKQDNALIVFNLIKHNTTITQDIVNEMKSFNIKIAETKIQDLVSFTRSILVDTLDSKAQDHIDNLTEEILNMII